MNHLMHREIRLIWMDHALETGGFTRPNLAERFGVSINRAALDVKEYKRISGGAIRHVVCPGTRRYMRKSGNHPVYPEPLRLAVMALLAEMDKHKEEQG